MFPLKTTLLYNSKSKYHVYRTLTGLNLWSQEISNEIKLKIEEHWKNHIVHASFDENDKTKAKCYILSMFPYPSGKLHMGHVRVYTISDAVARFQRMQGKNVLHPIGWDAFGLPAENAAIEKGFLPSNWTSNNINEMRSQLKELGCSFDWEREITTCFPDYYKWTQELFLKLYENGLVYQKEALVNWDPVDKTVLAEEQVDENGLSWRSGAKVEKKYLRQWFVKTTAFAKDLFDGLSDSNLEDWRDIIKLQKHWIGDCDGVNFDFKIADTNEKVTLWTSYPEYIAHVKFVTVSDGHELLRYETTQYSGTEKLKIKLKNPFTQEDIPVFYSKEIEYLPFCNSFIGIPSICTEARTFAENHSISFNEIQKIECNLKLKEIRRNICAEARSKNIGGYWSSAKLKDWLISRQRYWGTPIPMINCNTCGIVPVPRNQLPVELPVITRNLKEHTDWLVTPCPKCGEKDARRESDTMDTFFDSSWYYLRFLDPKNKSESFSKNIVNEMMPIDLYIGGKEHAVLHLYYARFISYFLNSLGYLPEKEPFRRLLVQGMVMGKSYRSKISGKYLKPEDVHVLDAKKDKAVHKETGDKVIVTWEKMSKSKFNGVDPSDMFSKYGVDTTRLLILADVAPTSHRKWNENTFPGIINWQKRLWLTIQDFLKHRQNPPTQHITDEEINNFESYMFDSRNYYIKGTTFNYFISQQLSIAVSKQQGLTNSIRRMPSYVVAHSKQYERALAAQIILLSPMAPHFASELWSGFISAPNRLNIDVDEINWNEDVLQQNWPIIDENYKLEFIIQVNGNEKCKLKILRKELDVLNKDIAISIAMNENEIKSMFSVKKLKDASFTLHKGLVGYLNLNTEYQEIAEKIKQ